MDLKSIPLPFALFPVQDCVTDGVPDESGKRAAVHTLRVIQKRLAFAPALGVRWLQHRFSAGKSFPMFVASSRGPKRR
jgi:hypothetical protein